MGELIAVSSAVNAGYGAVAWLRIDPQNRSPQANPP
jgi:hypothetical protein